MDFFSDFTELNELGVETYTNTASSWRNPAGDTVEAEGLLRRYDFFLSRLREQGTTRVLELGAGPNDNIGASMRMWRRYFSPSTEIHVAERNPAAEILSHEGFHPHIGDLGNPEFLNRLASRKWDFVLDDASHLWTHQIMAFRALFPALRSGGIFICEDLCTSFGPMRGPYSQGLDMRDPVQYFQELSRRTCGHPQTSAEEAAGTYALTEADRALTHSIHMICWMSNSVIVVKR